VSSCGSSRWLGFRYARCRRAVRIEVIQQRDDLFLGTASSSEFTMNNRPGGDTGSSGVDVELRPWLDGLHRRPM